MAVCICIISKENRPLFTWTREGCDALQLHYLAHQALDFIEEKVSSGKLPPNAPRPPEAAELFHNLLYSTEHHRIFGYTTTTRTKLVIVTPNTSTPQRDNDIRGMFRQLHQCYTELVCNPFYVLETPITQKSFEKKVVALAQNMNSLAC